MIRHGILILLLFTFVVPLSVAQKIYVWRDENGNLVYSDTPAEGAQEVKLDKHNNALPAEDTSNLNPGQTVEAPARFAIQITKPTHEQTIRDNTGAVTIAGRVTPRLPRGHKVQLYIDNQPYQGPGDTTHYRLKNVDRGEHQLRFELISEEGKVIASSEVITFFMHRSTSLSPARTGG